MNALEAAVQHVNRSSSDFEFIIDQRFFLLPKQREWSFAGTYTEDNFVVILSGLYIENTAYKVLRT